MNEAGHGKWHKVRSKKSKRREACRKNALKVWENKDKRSEDASCADINAVKGASTKKIERFQTTLPEQEASKEDENLKSEEYMFISIDCLKNLFNNCEKFCEMCASNQTFYLDIGKKLGYACKINLKCLQCHQVLSGEFNSPRVSDNKSPFDINKKVVNSFLNNGDGHSGLLNFSQSMNMRCLSVSAYYILLASIQKDHMNVRTRILQRSREVVFEANKTSGIEEDEDGVLDIAVSFDGSWPKRGHSSLFGFSCVIDTLTGLILDYVILSKYCAMCEMRSKHMDTDSQEFTLWYKNHKSSQECCQNYCGSSGGMEAAAAEILWKRSIADCKMRYTTLVSDGDSKTFKHLCQLNVYSVPVVKEECVNHVNKRLKTAMLELVKFERAKGITLGGKKKGLFLY